MRFLFWFCAAAVAFTAAAQTNNITEVRVQAEGGAKVRPGESVALQAQVWGDAVDKDGNRKSGRLREAATFQAPTSGLISKPFRWQGSDSGDYVNTATGTFASILQGVTAKFVTKDAVLYTAPTQPGKYTVSAKARETTGSIEIEVDANAPSRVTAEKHNFDPAPEDKNRYRKMAEHHAPYVAQETWWQPKADIPTRFDLDGDWDGDNNWENMEIGTSQAYGYYAGVETSTHWFLHYNFFHPRDYSDNCVAGTCHENDNEGLILTVRKDGTEFGRLEVMETLAHNNVYSYTNVAALRKGAHDIDAKIEFFEEHHPIIFIEAGGHGILGSAARGSTFNAARMDFTENGTGITFAYKGKAERAGSASARNVGYDLISIEDSWWSRANQESGKMFDAGYVYEPFGNRPRGSGKFMGSFLGRKYGSNKAKPFWGWHDERTRRGKVLNTGQWALDPAYAVSKNLTWPANLPVDLNYSYNPYLGFSDVPLAPVVAPAPGDSTPVSTGATEGSCEIQVTVDAIIDVIVGPGGVSYQTINGQPERDTKSTCTSANLPGGTVETYEVRKQSGRGSVELKERPLAENGWTAKIRLTDSKGGADRHSLAIRWKK